MLAERLGLPQLTFANKVEVDRRRPLTIQRQTDDGYDVVESSLPAVVSVVEKINEPRYPSFKGIMAAKKKPVQTLALADLGLEPAAVGLAGAWTAVDDFAQRPPRAGRNGHHRRGRRRRQGRRLPRRPEVHLSRSRRSRRISMSCRDPRPRRATPTAPSRRCTLELLTAGSRLGEPVARSSSAPAPHGAAATLAQYGAAKVYVADDAALTASVVAPKVAVLAKLVAERRTGRGAHPVDRRGQGDRRSPGGPHRHRRHHRRRRHRATASWPCSRSSAAAPSCARRSPPARRSSRCARTRRRPSRRAGRR